MIKRTGTAAFALALSAASLIVTAGSAPAAIPACKVQQDGNTWVCVTPGAFCPKAAHTRYGYAKTTRIRYRCSWYPAERRLRWKKAAVAACKPTPTVTVTVIKDPEPTATPQ